MTMFAKVQQKLNVGKEAIYVEVITITPKMAKEFLTIGNDRDRPLSNYRVKNLVETIQRGEWRTNTDCLGFTSTGARMNGNHRLNAIVMAGIPVTVLVAYNMPEESFLTTDTGAKRTSGDIAGIIGLKKHYKAVGSAINLLWKYNRGTVHVPDVSPTNMQIHRLLIQNMAIEDSAVVGISIWPVLSGGIATFCHYLFSQIDVVKTKTFFEGLRTGANLEAGNPILVLRNRLTAEKSGKSVLPQYEIVALVIKAWNFYRKGRKTRTLKWAHGQGEEFPEAI